jgi:hypothetical protein
VLVGRQFAKVFTRLCQVTYHNALRLRRKPFNNDGGESLAASNVK